MPTIPHWIQTWAVRDGLGSTNQSSAVPNALKGSNAVRYEFGTGSNQGLVTHIMDGTVSSKGVGGRIIQTAADSDFQKIGHDWPSTVLNDDAKGNHDPAASFNASSIILEFFAAHPLPL